MKKRSIICLMGPTASGKTQLAVKLTQRFPFEIISVDSAMVYRGMDIGTAKPSADILKSAPHRLINIRDPNDAYSAAQCREDALREITDIFSHHNIPLLVGGTMLYFHALQEGLAPLPSKNTKIRKVLRQEADTLGLDVLYQELSIVDPIAANRIHRHDSQRIQRALEVYRLTGKNLTTWQEEHHKTTIEYSVINIAIAPKDRSILHERIALRFQEMLDHGFIDEVQHLFERGDLTLETPAIRSVGYRQVWEYLLGNMAFNEMKEKGIIATRQLAKRQLTWLRNWPHLVWFDSEAPDLYDKVSHYLTSLKG